MMKILTTSFLAMLFIVSQAWSDDGKAQPVQPEREKDRISYSLGNQIGSDFRHQGDDIDPEAFLQGLRDALAGADPKIIEEEMRSTLVAKKKQILSRQRSEKMEMREQRLGEGARFLKNNANRKGVIVLPSGLQYEVLKPGTGKTPGPEGKVIVHYEGSLIDGRIIGSSLRKSEPETFYVNGVMKGLSEALQVMKEGDRWKVYLPPDLAIGNRGELANRTLIYDLELISVEPAEQLKPAKH